MGSLSVAICTRNRADRLRQVLASLCAATPPRHAEWEVVVVLNACTDSSAEVAQSFDGRLPVVAVVEEQEGLSHARNRAVEACRGEYIVFVDDDARVGPLFLVAYEAAFRKWPEADVFGGPIVPLFEGGPPAWLEEALPAFGSAFGLQKVERDGTPIEPGAPPYGTNYAIRSSLQKSRRYNTELGRGGVPWLRGGEEIELLAAVLTSGATGVWLADAAVEHVMAPDRQTLRYLWRYYEGYGMLVGLTERSRRRRLSALSAAGEMAAAELVYRVARLVAAPARWAPAMVRAAVRRGKWKSRYLA